MRKKSIISVLMLVFALTSGLMQAQDSKLALGGGLVYASDISSAGIFVAGNYSITEQWEAAADFTYFFPKDYGWNVKYTWMAFNVNAHYVFYKQDKLAAYGLGGLNVLMIRIPSYEYSYGGQTVKTPSASSSNMGFNLGAGARYSLNDKISALGEIKYVIGNASYLQLNVGILFSL